MPHSRDAVTCARSTAARRARPGHLGTRVRCFTAHNRPYAPQHPREMVPFGFIREPCACHSSKRRVVHLGKISTMMAFVCASRDMELATWAGGAVSCWPSLLAVVVVAPGLVLLVGAGLRTATRRTSARWRMRYGNRLRSYEK